MPRFVILEHDHPHLHWDLMLQDGAVLRTWRLSVPPAAGAPSLAEPIGDHRPLYLDYEGPVSNNRGQVARWDAGTFDWLSRQADAIDVHLRGQRLTGILRLHRRSDGIWHALLAEID